MRTTLTLDDDVADKLRRLAERRGASLKSAVVPAFSAADLRRALTSEGGFSVSVVWEGTASSYAPPPL